MTFFSGFHVIACIRSWQNVVNTLEKGKIVFQFNTYIISVLVIFYLQMNHNFPKIKDVTSSKSKIINAVPNFNKGLLREAVGGFFKFYADNYEIKNHLISVNIGRWQQRHLNSRELKSPSPEQKR